MPDTYYESRKRWNAANYKQLNLSIKPELMEEFHKACEQSGTSMRKAIVEFMESYSKVPAACARPKGKGYNERRHRKNAVKSIATQLEAIRGAEEQYMDNMPENLRNSSRYGDAEQAADALDGAVQLLNSVYM